MGFSDNSGDIYIDAVLTDEGRERLARNDGTFAIVRWRPADDEIDYRFWNGLTGSDSKDAKILDTPIFEAFSNEGIALRYPLVTIRNARLQFLPEFVANPAGGVILQEQTDSVGGGADITVSQQVPRSQTILPAEVIDVNYQIELDNDLVFVSNVTPISITPYGRARYIIPGTGKTAAGGTECKFNVRVQTLTTEIFDVLFGAATQGIVRTISTTIIVTGQQSGMNISIPVTIKEFSS
jgi:hypothetical protein